MSRQLRDLSHGGTPPENYERYFVPAIGAPLAEDLIAAAGLRPGERVLDVACGTGVVTRLAAEGVGGTGKVAGLDLNPGMLAVARSATPEISWYEASVEEMPLPDGSFDVALCQMGLQFVTDKERALREMFRILAPGGRLVLNVPGPIPPLMAVMARALGRHMGPEAEGFVQHVFSLHDAAELQALIEGAGFQDVAIQAGMKRLRLPAPDRFLWEYVSSTPLAEPVAKAGDERRGLLERDVVAGLGEFETEGSMHLELRMVVASARKN